jgi:hypothetical protein
MDAAGFAVVDRRKLWSRQSREWRHSAVRRIAERVEQSAGGVRICVEDRTTEEADCS